MDTYLRPEGTQLRQGHPEPAKTPAREANPLELLLAIAADPRNSWIGGPGKILHGVEALPALLGGLGRLFHDERGWEVLKRYIDKGGTPKTLRDLLRKRGYDEAATSAISNDVRQGTDLAAPSPYAGMTYTPGSVSTANNRAELLRNRYPEDRIPLRQTVPLEQRDSLERAEGTLMHNEPGSSGYMHARKRAGDLMRTAGDRSAALQHEADTIGGIIDPLPSGTQGQAAYNAISSRMARMMDDPNFLSLREHYLPPPVSDKAYYRELPIVSQHEGIERLMRQYGGMAPAERDRALLERHGIFRHSDSDVYGPGGLVDQAIDAGEAGNHQLANRLMNQVDEHSRMIGRPDLAVPQEMRESLHPSAGAPSQRELYGEPDVRPVPRTHSAQENQRTSDLNRRADINQNLSPEFERTVPGSAYEAAMDQNPQVVINAARSAVPRYQVYDPRTGVVHGTYTQRGRARAHQDRLDNEYGAVRYQVRTLEPPTEGTP